MGWAVTICLVASMPSRFGMRISISTTSGVYRWASEMASTPSPCLAEHVEIAFSLEDHAKAGTDERLVIHEEDGRGHACTGLRLTRKVVDTATPLGSRTGSRNPPNRAARSRMPSIPCPVPVEGEMAAPSSSTSTSTSGES